MLADNVLKISYLPSKLLFSAKYRQSLSRGHYQPTNYPPEEVYLLNTYTWERGWLLCCISAHAMSECPLRRGLGRQYKSLGWLDRARFCWLGFGRVCFSFTSNYMKWAASELSTVPQL